MDSSRHDRARGIFQCDAAFSRSSSILRLLSTKKWDRSLRFSPPFFYFLLSLSFFLFFVWKTKLTMAPPTPSSFYCLSLVFILVYRMNFFIGPRFNGTRSEREKGGERERIQAARLFRPFFPPSLFLWKH